MDNPYDIAEAFAAIEKELVSSMMRNMERHRVEEINEKKQWAMWQAMQLKALEKYKRDNRKKFGKRFKELNGRIERMIRQANEAGGMEQELAVLRAIQRGYRFPHLPQRIQKILEGLDGTASLTGEFFRLNERKLDALVKATAHDMEKAETAILRMSDDQYRRAIFNAQVYANTGSGTYEKAVDLATKDMLAAGLNCVVYKNGARHTLADYADMALRTAAKRAYLQGEGIKRQEWGISTVIMNKRGNPCPKCLPFCGKILIDDVWSGGSRKDGPYPLMSSAIAAGLYHPRCRDSHTTYFEGISTPPDDKYTEKELSDIRQSAKREAKQQYARRQAERFGRLAEYSLDVDNKRQYQRKADAWKKVYFKTGGMDVGEYADSKRPLAHFHAVSQEQVVNVLRRESEEWIKTLTDEEKRAVRKYTYNSGDKKPNRFFERLNAMLRGDLPENENLKKYAETISRALKKNKLKQDVIAFRGMNVDPTNGAMPGALIKPGQFFSSSVNGTHSFKMGYKLVIYVKRGSNAAYIEKLSSFPKQRELLLDKDCVYRVISRKDNLIELEVI